MNKFTKVQENISLGRFSITDAQFREYMNMVDSILRTMYGNSSRQKVDTLSLIKALPYEKREVVGREFSVLNKVNTNRSLMYTLVSNFKLKSFDELKNLITENKQDFFTEDGQYFNMVWETIRKTEKIGEESEDQVVLYIRNLFKEKYNVDVTPIREATSSVKDMLHGIDITFTFKGKDYTCQVKPLKESSMDKDNVIITSSGRLKQYSTTYIAFASKGKPVLMFRNKDVHIDGDIITIPKSNSVK